MEARGKTGDSMKSEGEKQKHQSWLFQMKRSIFLIISCVISQCITLGRNSKWFALSVAICVTFFASTVIFISGFTKSRGIWSFLVVGVSIIVVGIVACVCICVSASEKSLDASKLVCSGIEEILKETNVNYGNLEFTLVGKYIGKRQVDNFIQCQIHGNDV